MEEELINAFLEEYQGGKDELAKNRFKNSVILLSKALFALCDYLIYKKVNVLPKNHSERFRLLEEYFPLVYPIVDSIFGQYTDAYSKPILKETCEEINHAFQTIKTQVELPKRIKEIIK